MPGVIVYMYAHRYSNGNPQNGMSGTFLKKKKKKRADKMPAVAVSVICKTHRINMGTRIGQFGAQLKKKIVPSLVVAVAFGIDSDDSHEKRNRFLLPNVLP